MTPTHPNPAFQVNVNANVSQTEYQLLQDLRRRSPAQQPVRQSLTLGDRIADQVAATMGSWPFIIIQSLLLGSWVILNVIGWVAHWDPYPFILLNLMLSFQAAYAAPIIMMSQNRQAAIDRQTAQHDYEIDIKAELEIELLHDQIALLRQDLSQVVALLQEQQQTLEQLKAKVQTSG